MRLAIFFLGVILLTMGGRLFWLFIGVVGFIFGYDFAGTLLAHQPHYVVEVVALLVGLICAVLAVYLQKFAIAIAGFLAGGHLFPQLFAMLGFAAAHQYHWLLYIVGGIIGAVLMLLTFQFALILLSSLIGTNMVLHALHLEGRGFIILFVLLFALGFALQYGWISRKPGVQ
jgi:hypothetical protein